MESGGKKKMELWVKIMLSLAAVGCIGAISYGCVTLNNMKQNEVQQAAVSTTIEVTDSSSTQTQQTPETKEENYELEAETAFKANELPENIKEQFIADYIAYREKGLSVEDFLPDLLDKYLIASQEEIQANVSSEDGEIETEEDEAYQAQLNKEAQAEQSEPEKTEEADFEVLYLDNTEMYAQSNVNIRAGAGITYDKVGSLSQNEAVTVIGLAITKDNKEWYQLGDADGNLIGYVSATYLGKSKVQVQQSQQAATTTESSGQQSNNSQATAQNSNSGTAGNSNGTVNSDGSLNLDKLAEMGFEINADHTGSDGSGMGLGQTHYASGEGVDVH